MKKKNEGAVARGGTNKSKRIFIIFTSVFLGIILLVGIVLGAVSITRDATSVMKYKGIYLKAGVANYLATSYKYDFMKTLTRNGVECYDNESFWQSEAEDGTSYAELLAVGAENYVKRVIVGSYLFDRNTRLSKDDKAVIKAAVNDVLEYRAGGDEAQFNEMASDMGFTFSDFEKAAELLYKYEMAETVIFGYDGAALNSSSFVAECDDYFEKNYSRVMLMFIRTDGELITDPVTGESELSVYDESMKAKVQQEISDIRTLIYNAENNMGDEQMSASSFIEWYIAKKYPTGTANDTSGYYFCASSSYTSEFAQSAPEIVKLAFSTEIGHYAECEVDFGVCFIYRCEPEEGAYSRSSLEHFFTDFYDDAAAYIYSASVDSYLTDVAVKEKYDRYAIVTKPYNHELSVKFG